SLWRLGLVHSARFLNGTRMNGSTRNLRALKPGTNLALHSTRRWRFCYILNTTCAARVSAAVGRQNLRSMPKHYNSTLQSAHNRSSKHREEVVASDICGCFYCRQTFPPSEIEEWVDEQ